MAKAKPGYKLVKSLFGKYEEIPEDWNYSRITTMLEKDKDIVAGPFGSNLKVSDYREQGVPIIRLQNIQRNNFIDKNIKFISNEKAKELSYHSYKSGDLVLAKLGDPIGKTCRIPKNFPGGIVVADVVRIRNSPKKSDVKFMEYVLNSNFSTKQFNKEKIGSTRPRVNLDDVRNLLFFFPPLSEQQKIASIFSNIDNLIDAFGKSIENTTRLKQGLMQKLLTKGIGHKKFKKVKWLFGKEIEIPDTWNYAKIKNISTKLVVGFVGTCNPFYTDSIGVPMLRTTNVKEGKLDLSNLKYITREFHEKNMKSQVFENDLLVSRHGENGEACLVRNLKEANCLNTVIIRCNKDIFLPDFFETSFNSLIVRKQIQRTTAGGVQGVVNTGEIAKVKIIIPSLEEQQKTASILSAVDDVISDLESKKKSLEFIKKGLMQKLLTGQIRVKV